FEQNLTFLGTETVPAHWSFAGWLDDNPARPFAFTRDSGLLMLVAGSQGSGKTVLSTLLCEGSLYACPMLTSRTILPTCFAFFHLEEQDRLPQILDGLKPNPTQRDLELLLRRLGLGPMALPRLNLAVPDFLLADLKE